MSYNEGLAQTNSINSSYNIVFHINSSTKSVHLWSEKFDIWNVISDQPNQRGS